MGIRVHKRSLVQQLETTEQRDFLNLREMCARKNIFVLE
jgi:hypothetical protein